MDRGKGQDITAYLSMDISDLKKAITQARKEIASINSSFTEVAGKSSKWEHSSDLLIKKLEQLKKLIAEKRELIKVYNAIIEKSSKSYSDNEKEAGELQERLRQLKDAGEDNTEEFAELSRKLEVCESNMLDAQKTNRDYATTVSNTKGEIVDLERDLKNYESELEDVYKEEERQKTALGQLEKKIEDQEEELEDLKEAYKDVVVEQGKNSDSAKELAKKIDDLSGELKENKDVLNDASKAADELDNSLGDDDGLNKAKDGFTVLKGVVVNFVTEALHKAIDGFKDLMNKAIEFESSFADVRKVLGDVPTEDLENLEQDIRDLSKIRPETASEIAEVTSMAAQLGVRGNDNLIKFTDTMVKLGDSTNLTSQEAAETFAKFINVMGTSQGEIDKVGATVVNLGNNFATTEKDIAEMSMRLGAAGKLAGMTEPEVMGIATALSSVGIASEAGGSAFSKLIINMSNASANGKKANEIIASTGQSLRDLQMLSDSDSKAFKELAQSLGYTSDEFSDFLDASATLEQFSKVTGMTADEFNKAYGEDAVGTIQKFINSLAGMSNTDALQTLDEMGIKEIRLRDTILRSTTGVENFNKALEIANEGWEENIALDNEANQRYQTTESRMKMMKNKFTDVGISLKKELQPAIDAFISALGWIADNAEAVGAALFVVVSAISGFLIVSKVLPLLKSLNLVLLANPAGLIAAAIAALVAAFVILLIKCKPFRDFFVNMWKTISSAFSKAWNGVIKPILDALKVGIETIFNVLQMVWENGIQPLFESIIEGVSILWSTGIEPVLGFILEGVGALFDALKVLWDEVLHPVVDEIGGAFQWLWDTVISVILMAMAATFSAVWYAIKGLWEGVLQPVFKALGEFFKWVWENILSPTLSLMKKGFEGAFSGIKWVWENVLKPAFQAIGDFFKWIWDNILGPAVSAMQEGFETAIGAIEKVFRGLYKIIQGIVNGILGAIEAMCNGVVDGMNLVIGALNKLHFDIPDWVPGLGGKSFGFDIDKIKHVDIPRLPDLPEYEKGGIIRKGQIGLLEGKGTEAVVPLDKNKFWVSAVAKDMKKEFDREAIATSINDSKQTVNNFTQIINAPKQPSRIELYRQTRNLLNFSQGGV